MGNPERSDFGKDKRVDEAHRLMCLTCKIKTNHKVLRSITHDWATEDYEIQGSDDYMIVQCQGCEGISYSTFSVDSDDTHPETNEPFLWIRLYPERYIEHTTITLPHSTPFNIRDAYKDTSKALSVDLVGLAAIGIRLIIQLVCKDQKAIGRELVGQIDSLQEMGTISKSLADTLHGIRLFGNDAAHDYKIKKSEVTPAWETVNLLVSYVYGNEDNRGVLLTPEREAKLENHRIRKVKKVKK